MICHHALPRPIFLGTINILYNKYFPNEFRWGKVWWHSTFLWWLLIKWYFHTLLYKIYVRKSVIFYAPLHTVKEPNPYKYQVRMWAFYNTTRYRKGSWAFVYWIWPTFLQIYLHTFHTQWKQDQNSNDPNRFQYFLLSFECPGNSFHRSRGQTPHYIFIDTTG